VGGTELEVKLDATQNAARSLKLAIQDGQGISISTHQPPLVSTKKKGDNQPGWCMWVKELGRSKQEPLNDGGLVSCPADVASCFFPR
jgi:hypothetical protein